MFRLLSTGPLRQLAKRARVQVPPPKTSFPQVRHASYQRFGERGVSKQTPISYARQRVKNTPPIIWVVAGGGGVYYVFHLERTETGRLRFLDSTVADERQMGEMAAKQVLQEYSHAILPPSHPTTRMVQKVADRLIRANGLGAGATSRDPARIESQDHGETAVQWKVRVIDDPSTKNAFVLPNGAIFVFTGILPVCANEDGLAAVLGHEMAHQVLRHGGERMSSQKVYMALQYLASFIFGIDQGLSQGAVGVLLQLPNSRTSETEADQVGLRLASRACYDPEEAVHMWERMQQSEGGSGGMDFLSTHPANERRIKAIRKWLTEADQLREDNCGPTMQASKAFGQVAGFR